MTQECKHLFNSKFILLTSAGKHNPADEWQRINPLNIWETYTWKGYNALKHIMQVQKQNRWISSQNLNLYIIIFRVLIIYFEQYSN